MGFIGNVMNVVTWPFLKTLSGVELYTRDTKLYTSYKVEI